MSADLSPEDAIDALRCALAENRRLRDERDVAVTDAQKHQRLAEQSVVRLEAQTDRIVRAEELRDAATSLCELGADLAARALSVMDVLEERCVERGRALQREAQHTQNSVAHLRALLERR